LADMKADVEFFERFTGNVGAVAHSGLGVD
jgi:hypothetical protein